MLLQEAHPLSTQLCGIHCLLEGLLVVEVKGPEGKERRKELEKLPLKVS